MDSTQPHERNALGRSTASFRSGSGRVPPSSSAGRTLVSPWPNHFPTNICHGGYAGFSGLDVLLIEGGCVAVSLSLRPARGQEVGRMTVRRTPKDRDLHFFVNANDLEAVERLAISEGRTFSELVRHDVRTNGDHAPVSLPVGKQRRVHLRLGEDDETASRSTANVAGVTVSAIYRAAVHELAKSARRRPGGS